MAVETEADRALFISSDDFGVDAECNSVEITGIFEDNYIEREGFSSLEPTFLTSQENVTDASIFTGDTLSIGALDYTIKDRQKDGTGMWLLILADQ